MRQDKIAFMHFRNVDTQGRISPTGGFTIAYHATDLGDTTEIVYQYSECGKKEHYKRRLGSNIAKGRLLSHKLNNYTAVVQSDIWFDQFENDLITSYQDVTGQRVVNTSRSKLIVLA